MNIFCCHGAEITIRDYDLVDSAFWYEKPFEITMREYRYSDKDAVMAIGRQNLDQLITAAATKRKELSPEQFEERYTALLSRVFDANRGLRIVLLKYQRIIGFVECYQENDYAKISGLMIVHGERRNGYGRWLLRHVIDRARQQLTALAKVKLDVNADNEAAQRLYLSEGFTQSVSQPWELSNIGVLRYEKNLIQ